MRINKFVALASGMSRRAADAAIGQGRVAVDGRAATLGQEVTESQKVTLDGQVLQSVSQHKTIMLNKPAGYVVSRDGQGSKTIYDLIPDELHELKPIGRLDKYSSGLLLLTNDGMLAHELTHPRYHKMKVYQVSLNKPLTPADWQKITTEGVLLDDGPSKFELRQHEKNDGTQWIVTMYEGRNRQIRRTFEALGYRVTGLHRTRFGAFILENTTPGEWHHLKESTAL